MKYTFWFECTDNGGGHQAFEVKAENKQEAIKKGMACLLYTSPSPRD